MVTMPVINGIIFKFSVIIQVHYVFVNLPLVSQYIEASKAYVKRNSQNRIYENLATLHCKTRKRCFLHTAYEM